MDAYRAIYTHLVPSTEEAGAYVAVRDPVVVTGSIVVPAYITPGGELVLPELRYSAVRQDNGAHVEPFGFELECSESGYRGTEEPKAPDWHEHDLGSAEPVLEGTRMTGMVRKCKVEGCDFGIMVPTKP